MGYESDETLRVLVQIGRFTLRTPQYLRMLAGAVAFGLAPARAVVSHVPGIGSKSRGYRLMMRNHNVSYSYSDVTEVLTSFEDFRNMQKLCRMYGVDFSILRDRDSGMLVMKYETKDREAFAAVLEHGLKTGLLTKRDLDQARSIATGKPWDPTFYGGFSWVKDDNGSAGGGAPELETWTCRFTDMDGREMTMRASSDGEWSIGLADGDTAQFLGYRCAGRSSKGLSGAMDACINHSLVFIDKQCRAQNRKFSETMNMDYEKMWSHLGDVERKAAKDARRHRHAERHDRSHVNAQG